MGSLPKPIRKVIKLEIFIVLILLLVLNPMGSNFVTSINNQEIFTYHIRDILEYFMEEKQNMDEFYLAAGTYEGQLGGGLFGAAKGRNLIVVQMESMQNMLINKDYFGQEITPVLNELIRSPGTVYFNNFYYQIGTGNTSDAEFAANNAIMGSMDSYTYQLYQHNYFRGLPWILKERGYGSYVFHGYKKEFWNRENIYPALGFDKYYCSGYFINDNIEGIGGGNITGISDSAFFDQATDYMAELPQPFYSFLMTLSCHHPFKMPEFLRDIEIRPAEANIVGDYINAVHYSDKCIGEFMEHLKEKELYDNSIIVFYADHFGLSKADSRIDEVVSRWIGKPYTFDMMLNIPLIIHIPGADINATYENSGGQLDLMPTLAFLLGIERLDTLYLGQNLFTGNDSTVAIQVHMLKGSYIKGDHVLEISRDGIFENSRAWNRRTGEAIPLSGYVAGNSQRAREIIELSAFYLRHDVLRLALEQGRNMDEIREIISGRQTGLPDRMEARYIKAGDSGALERFFSAMRGDREKYTLLMSDDIFALLEELEFQYSGRPQITRGVGGLDEAMNKDFLDVRARIIPAVSAGDSYTKIEYLGYDKIMLAPGADILLGGELLELLETNSPAGIAVSRGSWRRTMNMWRDSSVPIYIYHTNAPIGSEETPVYRQPWK